MTRISMRARFAPRQKWGPPPPKAMWGLGERPMSNVVGVLEDVLVAVGRDVEEDDLLVLLDAAGRGSRPARWSGGGSS